MVYKTWDYCFFLLCPSSGVLLQIVYIQIKYNNLLIIPRRSAMPNYYLDANT
jgi:hypothetical protein